MQVAHISIRNILGIESLDIEAGKFIAVTGRNGTGKTSVVEAVKAALGGGHDATLLRTGADRGEIVLVLDDGSTITKRVTAGKSEQVFTDGEGRKIARPAESIKALYDALSVNPVEFLTVPKKQQVAALLEAMPMQADIGKLSEITGFGLSADHYRGMHAMDAIESVRKSVYDERTGVNRAAKEKASTAKQLAESLPPESGGDAATEEAELRQDLIDLDVGVRDAIAGVEEEMDGALSFVFDEINVLQKKIQELRDKDNSIRMEAQKKKSAINEKAAALRSETNAKLDAITKNREAVARAAQARETLERMTNEAKDLEEQADRLTGALARLEEYKVSLLSSLPIPGLEVRDGEIFYNGVVFERLNSAEQVKVAVELAKLRAGKLGLVCVDGIERLDSEAFEAFREASIASGLQMVVTRVGDSPFTVETAA